MKLHFFYNKRCRECWNHLAKSVSLEKSLRHFDFISDSGSYMLAIHIYLYVSNTQVHCNRWFLFSNYLEKLVVEKKNLKCFFLCFYLKSLKITKDFTKIHAMHCDIVTYLDTKYIQPSGTSLISVTELSQSQRLKKVAEGVLGENHSPINTFLSSQ